MFPHSPLRLWLFLSLLIFPVLRSAAQETPLPITSSMEGAFEHGRRNSRVPFRATLDNNTSRDRTVTLLFNDRWGNHANAQNYSLLIPAGERVRMVVYPALSSNLRYEVKESGKGSNSLSIDDDYKRIYAVIQEKTPVEWNLLKDSSYDAGVSSCDLMKWPADYRMYESQSCIIMPEKIYQSYFDEPHRKAIRQWVLGGGNLWLIGEKGQPVTTRILGNGRILHVPSLSGLPENEQKKQIDELVRKDSSAFKVAPSSSLLYDQDSSYFFSTPSIAPGLLLIAFAVLVGPFCLFLWAPSGKRQRLFILVPSISLGFCILLGLCILIGDGTGGTGERDVCILVNSRDHTGLILQSQVSKTSVLATNSFTLPEHAGIYGTLNRKKHESITIQELENTAREGKRCSGNWFTSRSSLEHELSMPVSTRAALTLLETLPDGSPVFQSTFPGALYRLTYQDSSGKYWKISHLPPGQKMRAEPFIPEEKQVAPPPGHFLACMEEVEGDLGPIPTLPSIRWEKTNITVYGPVPVTTQPNE